MDLGYSRGSVIKWMVFSYVILTNHIIYLPLLTKNPMADFEVINKVLYFKIIFSMLQDQGREN